MKKTIKKHHDSFKNAFDGFKWSVRTHRNFRIHIIISIIVLIMAMAVGTTYLENVILIFAIVLGLSAEMINTSIESMTDLITKEWKSDAKIAKDVSAGMMLVVSVGAAVVAIIIFLPYFL